MQRQTEIEDNSSDVKAKSCIATSNARGLGGWGSGRRRRQREFDLKAARRAGVAHVGVVGTARRGGSSRRNGLSSRRAA